MSKKATNKTNTKAKAVESQLTPVENYDVKNMVFSDPISGSIDAGAGKAKINFKRVPIGTVYDDGTVGDLIIPTTKLFSFGISENTSLETKQPNGYSLPLCLWNRDGPTDEEKAWTDTFESIVKHCKKYVLENKETLEQYELEAAHLNKFNPLYWKKEKGKIVEGAGPVLYAKLIESKKQGKILSIFSDMEGNPVDPLQLKGKFCWAKAAIKIESIFVGSKVSLQVKLYQAQVELMEGGIKSLLPTKPKTVPKLLTGSNTTMAIDDEEDAGSIPNSDSEEAEVKEAPKPKVTKKVVKKVVKK